MSRCVWFRVVIQKPHSHHWLHVSTPFFFDWLLIWFQYVIIDRAHTRTNKLAIDFFCCARSKASECKLTIHTHTRVCIALYCQFNLKWKLRKKEINMNWQFCIENSTLERGGSFTFALTISLERIRVLFFFLSSHRCWKSHDLRHFNLPNFIFFFKFIIDFHLRWEGEREKQTLRDNNNY